VGYGALLTAALILAALVIGTIWKPLLLAAVLASALWRPHERVVALVRGRRSVASLLVTVGTLLFVLMPLTLLTLYLVGELVELTGHVREVVRRSGAAGLLNALPDRLEALVRSAAS
jgi:predicted PurR-regulated permease PerM